MRRCVCAKEMCFSLKSLGVMGSWWQLHRHIVPWHTGAQMQKLTQRKILPPLVLWMIPQVTLTVICGQKHVVWTEAEHVEITILKWL